MAQPSRRRKRLGRGTQGLRVTSRRAKPGGNSLDALRLWFRIEELLGLRLPLETLETDATPSRLAAAIEQKLRLSACRTALDQAGSAPRWLCTR